MVATTKLSPAGYGQAHVASAQPSVGRAVVDPQPVEGGELAQGSRHGPQEQVGVAQPGRLLYLLAGPGGVDGSRQRELGDLHRSGQTSGDGVAVGGDWLELVSRNR